MEAGEGGHREAGQPHRLGSHVEVGGHTKPWRGTWSRGRHPDPGGHTDPGGGTRNLGSTRSLGGAPGAWGSTWSLGGHPEPGGHTEPEGHTEPGGPHVRWIAVLTWLQKLCSTVLPQLADQISYKGPT